MIKLLLTSTGLTNQGIRDKFLQLINKPISQTKIGFVPTASRTKGELKYVQISKNELLDLGIPEANIKVLNLNKAVSFEEIKDFDVIYVCGGNTFYLLKKVRETGFDKAIKEFSRTDKLYFGVSAGSILAGPSIDIASPFDENDVELTDLTGLNLTDTVVTPHYKKEEESIIKPFTGKFSVVALTDNQALSITNEITEII